MTSKVFSGLVVVFWLVMMGALVRVEFSPEPAQFENVPTELILRKVFSNAEPMSMRVYYQKTPIGHSKLNITPSAAIDHNVPPRSGSRLAAYRMEGELTIYDLPFCETPTRLNLSAHGECDGRYRIQRFNVKATLGTNHLNVQGDMETRKIHWEYDGDGSHDDREFNLDDKSGNAFASSTGLPGLANSMLLMGLGSPPKPGASGALDRSASPVQMNISYGRLQVGELSQKTYIVESKFNDSMWVKVWVDEQGEVLLVDSSIGLSMRSNLIDGFDEERPMGTRSMPGSRRHWRDHDSD